MPDEPNPLFAFLDAAHGTRDGEFIRALASLVEANQISFEPSMEFDIRDSPGAEEYVNFDWGFAVRRSWLAEWIERAESTADRGQDASHRHTHPRRRPRGFSE